MKTKIWKKFSRKNLALIASSGVLIFVYQNCSRGFQTIENMSDFSSIAGSLQMQVGAFQKNPFTCASADVQSANSTQRMTRVQYANNLKNLIGAQAYPQFDSAVNTLYSDILKKTVGDFSNTISDTQMTAYQMIAESVYVYLKANVSVLQQLGGTCSQTTPLASICRDAFIQKIGLLAFHRPLTASEVQSWATNVFALGTDTNDSMAATIYAMMLAPDFLLHIEVGDGTSADTNTFNLTPYEVAARLSYGLMDAPPDQDLLDAAAAGQLSTSAQIEAQVDRILQTQPARDKINNFFTFWLDPRRYPAGDFGTDFLQGVDVAATNDEYARELTEYVDYVVFTKKGTFQDLITGAESFARTPTVASIYGHAVVTGTSPATMAPQRKGLFMRGSVIATDGNETHPILRGVKFRSRFLCQSLGIPSGINTNDPTFFSDTARAHYSTRDRTAGITAGQSCMGCHSSINPVGFAFENFDSLGRVRPFESAYSSAGVLLATYPIKTDSPGVSLGGNTTVPVHDGLDIVDSMMKENVLPGCFVRQVSRFYRIQVENQDDSCLLGSVYNKGILNPTASVLEVFRQQFLGPSLFKRRLN